MKKWEKRDGEKEENFVLSFSKFSSFSPSLLFETQSVRRRQLRCLLFPFALRKPMGSIFNVLSF